MTAVDTRDIIEKLSATSLDEDLVTLDNDFDDTRARRKSLLEKLETDINSVPSFLDGDKDAIAGKLNLVKTYAKVLSDTEAAISNRAAVKLKKKDQEVADNTNTLVTDLLLRCELTKLPSNGHLSDVDPTKLLDTTEDRTRRYMEEAEPIQDFELREDPHDLS